MSGLTLSSEEALVVSLRARRRRARQRTVAVAAVLAGLLFLAFSLEVLVGGTASIPLADIPAALVGQGNALANFVIFETRLPRALSGVFAGALFGLAGVLYQRLVSNVLATPDIIGISAGASAGAVFVLVSSGATGLAVQGGAAIGAVLAAMLIFAISWRHGTSTYRLVLVGIGMGACFSAVTSYLLLFADDATSTRVMRWMIGTLAGAEWPGVEVLAFALGLGVLAAWALQPGLETLRLGDPLSAALGTRVQAVRILTLVLGAALAALATSITGPIAFIALVSGPIASRLLPHVSLWPAALVGSTILLFSDVIAQSAPYVSPVPTGVVTGIVGAPVLLFLLLRSKGIPS